LGRSTPDAERVRVGEKGAVRRELGVLDRRGRVEGHVAAGIDIAEYQEIHPDRRVGIGSRFQILGLAGQRYPHQRHHNERRTGPGHVGYASAPGGIEMSSHALYLVRMDVAHDHEAMFNEIYDKEHVPTLRAVRGVRRPSRYRQRSPTEPRYLAAYE